MLTKLMLGSVLVTLAASSAAYARDSAWLLCKGTGEHGTGADKEKTYLAASLLEHRGTEDRDLGVTLIYGDHVMRGAIVGTKTVSFSGKAAPLKLAHVDKKGNAFTGTAMLSADLKTFTLKGTIDFTFGDDPKAKQAPFEAKLACEQLDDQAIGH